MSTHLQLSFKIGERVLALVDTTGERITRGEMRIEVVLGEKLSLELANAELFLEHRVGQPAERRGAEISTSTTETCTSKTCAAES